MIILESMDFKTWLSNTYDKNVIEYRRSLSWITATVTSYAAGNIFEQKHVDISIALLKQIPVPVLGKYPGEATDEDKEYFKTCLKPDYRQILQDEIRKIESLLTG